MNLPLTETFATELVFDALGQSLVVACLAVVGAALGTGVGLWAAHRQSPLIIGWLPGGFQVGFVHHFKP